MSAGSGERPARRPTVVLGLVAWLAALPALQFLTLTGWRLGNFASDRPWSYVAYGLAAPWVAWLVWRHHPRARFAAYVFLTHEAARGLHAGRWGAVLVAVAWVALLQLPAARCWLPSLRPGRIRPAAPARPVEEATAPDDGTQRGSRRGGSA